MEYSTFVYGKKIEDLMNSEILKTVPCLTLQNSTYFSRRLNKDTEIDIIVLSGFAIYSIECKGYTDLIRGLLSQRRWYGFSGRHQTAIYNPVMQNYMHVRTLRNYLNLAFNEWYDIHNYVVVLNDTRIETDATNVINIQTFQNILYNDSRTLQKRYDPDSLAYKIESSLKLGR
jgi:hypothetical protein